ncbi:MAG: hypothetical protein CL477_05060 [Acidobacteria bacterium]|nr:hypothetical protein [Acidobacteriota bacterium]
MSTAPLPRHHPKDVLVLERAEATGVRWCRLARRKQLRRTQQAADLIGAIRHAHVPPPFRDAYDRLSNGAGTCRASGCGEPRLAASAEPCVSATAA